MSDNAERTMALLQRAIDCFERMERASHERTHTFNMIANALTSIDARERAEAAKDASQEQAFKADAEAEARKMEVNKQVKLALSRVTEFL